MPLDRPCRAFDRFGKDVKEARKVMKMSRRVLAETIGIVPRYLANIENIGTLPSLPVFYAIIKLCRLPTDRYFFPEAYTEGSEARQRARMKLNLCPEQYLLIIEAAIDGAIKQGESGSE